MRVENWTRCAVVSSILFGLHRDTIASKDNNYCCVRMRVRAWGNSQRRKTKRLCSEDTREESTVGRRRRRSRRLFNPTTTTMVRVKSVSSFRTEYRIITAIMCYLHYNIYHYYTIVPMFWRSWRGPLPRPGCSGEIRRSVFRRFVVVREQRRFRFYIFPANIKNQTFECCTAQ